jgi:hypothetical protein
VIWAAVGAMTTVLLGALTLVSVWVARAIDGVRDDVRNARADLGARLDRIDDRLDRIETTVLRDHGERIARLEAR